MPSMEEELQRLHEALGQAARKSTLFPFLLGALVASTAFALLVALAGAAYWSWHTSQQQRRRLEDAADLAGAGRTRLRKLMGDALPAWATAPDSARVEWMNTLTEQLWPHIEAAASKLLLKDGLLEGLLNGTTFWRPALLMGAHIGVQAVVLGPEPPRITGAKTFRRHESRVDEVLMEFSFAWASKMEVKLLVTLLGNQVDRQNKLRQVLSRASRVKVGVSNLMARGTLRIALKPLLDELPVAGGFKVSLMGTPEFSYKVSTLGGNPYLLPGVEQLVASFVRENVLKPFTFPDGFSYDLVTGMVGQAFEKPQGLLEVTVVGATNVPRMDWYGKADPYCQLWLRENRKLRTATAKRTLTPTWNEKFTFIVHAPTVQELTLCIFDSDRLSADDLACMATVPLHTLDLTRPNTAEHFVPMARPDGKGNTAAPGPASGGGLAGTGLDFSGERERVVRVAGTGSVHTQLESEHSLAAQDSDAAEMAAAAGSPTSGTLGEPPRKKVRWKRRRKTDPSQPQQQEQYQRSATVLLRSPYQSSQQGTPQQSPRLDSALAPLSQEDAAALRQEAAQQERQQQMVADAAAEQVAAGSEAGGAAAESSGSGALTSAVSGAMSGAHSTLEHLARLAANPLEALRAKRCILHIQTTYLPLTAAEVEAMAREASRQRQGARSLTRRSGIHQRSGRIDSLMNSGVLYVYLDHATSLDSSRRGFTRNIEARVKVGSISKHTEHGQGPFRHRANPVFDESVELIVDGETAQRRNLEVSVEIWVLHLIRSPSFKGRVSLPLRQIIERGKWRDTWPLENTAQGTLTMELSWMGALAL